MRFLIMISLLPLMSNAFACSCATWPEDAEKAMTEAYELYPLIFLGTVKSVKTLPGRDEVQETMFSVHRVWKGPGDPITVTRAKLLLCGYEFNKGLTYLVFASLGDDDIYRVDICSFTLPISRATTYVGVLDKIHEKK